jgi:hypothetical protein
VNRLDISVYGTCRNCFGPHHSTSQGTFVWTRHFIRHAEWTDEYRVVPLGLLQAPRLSLPRGTGNLPVAAVRRGVGSHASRI